MMSPTYRTVLAVIAFASFIAVVVQKLHPKPFNHAYRPDDFAKKWDLGPMGKVSMWIDNTVHYQTHTAEGILEFKNLVPESGHLVHLTDPSDGSTKPYTPALFHQLHCLDVIRRDYVKRHASIGSQRCLNYLRQTILCHSDLRIESARSSLPPHLISFPGDYVCNDWNALYEAAKRNATSSR